MGERKPISSKLRFEIFKRDRFTCRYCGRTTPSVVLEVDHIVPVVEGGTNDPENLVTSCFECNRGKGCGSLDSIPMADEDMHERTVTLLEREMQLREYNQVLREIRGRRETEAGELIHRWLEMWGIKPDKANTSNTPSFFSLLNFLELIAVEDIVMAMRMTRNVVVGPYQGVKYLYGILHKWRKEGVKRWCAGGDKEAQ